MPDWNAALDETVVHLRRLLQIDTTNPPGNELAAARYLATVFEAAGIETSVIEGATDRGAVIARLQGTGEQRPLLLLAHMDVVAADPDAWSTEPFGGAILDGYVYGRGAIDDKGMLACHLAVMLRCAREQAAGAPPLARDIIFVATGDEESGGEWGLGWLLSVRPELMEAEYAINEGGRIRIVAGRPLYAAVQVAEKVSNIVTLVARGPAGHAAVPRAGSAIERLAGAVTRLSAHREPLRLMAATQEFLAGLAPVWPDVQEASLMRAAASADAAVAHRALEALSVLPAFGPLVRTTIAPTILAAGTQHNVIPADATATLSIRTLPGERLPDVMARLRRVVDDPAIELIVAAEGVDAPPSDHRMPMFAAIRAAIAELAPAMVTVPYLSTGATDSAILRGIGMQVYGLLPFPLDAEDEARMHGHDERVSVASLAFGVRLLHGTVTRIARPAVLSGTTDASGGPPSPCRNA